MHKQNYLCRSIWSKYMLFNHCNPDQRLYIYHKFSIKPPGGLLYSSTLKEAYWRGYLIDMGLNKVVTYEKMSYGDMTCTFQESSPITLSSS